jgi:hypothetical protein
MSGYVGLSAIHIKIKCGVLPPASAELNLISATFGLIPSFQASQGLRSEGEFLQRHAVYPAIHNRLNSDLTLLAYLHFFIRPLLNRNSIYGILNSSHAGLRYLLVTP